MRSRRRQQTDGRRRLYRGAAAGGLLVVAVVAILLITSRGDDGGRPGTDQAVAPPFELEAENVYAYTTRFHALQGLQVAVGDKLTFDNRDDKPHTFTSDEGLFDSGPIGPGRRYAYAYAAPGTYRYHCEIHPVMKGSVVVVPADK